MKPIIMFCAAGAMLTLVASAAAQTVTLESAPPVVVRTEPVAGAPRVDPRTSEILVTYSKAMQDGSWSWSTWGEENLPEIVGEPKYLADGRTCVIKVKLQPHKFYATWLNSDKFKNFKDTGGRPAVPYLLTFRTADRSGAAVGGRGGNSFGPAMETILKRPDHRVAELLDLDTGQRATSTDFGENDRETHVWIRDRKLDVLGVVEKGQIAVLCMDMAVLPVKGERWEQATVAEVGGDKMLAQMEPNKITGLSPATDKTDTWFFRTREGGHGILQIDGESAEPSGVKIRYKLALDGGSGGAPSGASSTASTTAGVLAPIPKAQVLPGKLMFHGRYRHRNRGGDIETPSELWVKESPDGSVNVLAQLPFRQSVELASGDPQHRLTSYRSGSDSSGGQPGYRMDLELHDGAVKLTRRGVRQDCDGKELKVPAGAWFDPNARPDSYCAANILLRAFALVAGETKEFRVYDWDNTGEGLVDYTIRVKHAGKERVEVPAGIFDANHLVLTQDSSADTWFKKRAGHVTDFWVLDNHVIVRVLRQREPYEMMLLDYTVPEKLAPASTIRSVAAPGKDSKAAATVQPTSAEPGKLDASLRLLNEDQRAVLAWTDRQFRSYFDARNFDGWSDKERSDLETRLIDTLKGPQSRDYFQAINTLGALRSTNALPALRAITYDRADKNHRDRWMAIRSLGLIGDRADVPELIRLVYHGNVNTRWWAQISLVRLTGQNFGKDWNAWGKWWNGQNGQPPYQAEIIRWWNGQAENDKLAASLDESDRKFLADLKPKS